MMSRDRQGRRIVDCEDKEVIGWLIEQLIDQVSEERSDQLK